MKFTVITPVYLTNDRAPLFYKCLASVENQTYDHNEFEHLIVNDGSPLSMDLTEYSRAHIVSQENLQRLTAYNTGFKNAKGDIFCLLDSDDAYEPDCLEKVAKMFEENPDYKMVNFGCTMIYKDGKEEKREAFKPKVEETGHEIFGGGRIVNGTFVFRRDVWEDLGAFPEGIKTINVPWYKSTELFWTSPYDFSAYAQVEFPEIQQYFTIKHPDHPAGLPKELGNPYGNDYYLFYKYTRKYHSHPFDEYLLRVNLR